MAESKAEYEKRLEKYLKVRAQTDLLHLRVGYVKLGVVAAGVVVLWMVLGKHGVAAYWLIAPVAGYLVVTIWHGLILRAEGACGDGGGVLSQGDCADGGSAGRGAGRRESGFAMRIMCMRKTWIFLGEGACLNCFLRRDCRWERSS